MLNKKDYLYNDEKSLLNRVNVIVKIFGLFVYILLILLKYDRLLFLFSISFVFILILLSNIKLSRFLKIVWKLKYIIIFMYVFMLYKQMELIDINIIVFRFVFLILYFELIFYTSSRENIGRGIASIIDRINLIGFSFKKIFLFFTNIIVFFSNYFDTYNDYFKRFEVDGIVYESSNILDRFIKYIKNFKNVFGINKEKMIDRKRDLKYRLYNNDSISIYKYREKLFIFDYLYVLINVGMILYYILKVR